MVIKTLLMLSIFLFLSLNLEGTNYRHVFGQRSRQASIYFAPYHINGPTPSIFEEFSYFEVFENPTDKSGTGKFVRVRGAVHTRNGTKYRFSIARLERDEVGISKLTFKAINAEGTEYRFEGIFLDRPELLRSTGNYTDLRGTLTREKKGRIIAQQRLDFFANIRE